MEVDKFGRFRSSTANSNGTIQLQLLRRQLKKEISSILSEKNLDKLILSASNVPNAPIHIRNVESDDNSTSTDVVNIAYMTKRIKSEIEKIIYGLNFDKLILVSTPKTNGASSLVRVRNVISDENSTLTDVVNVEYLMKNLHVLQKEIFALREDMEKLEKLEHRIERLENNDVN